MEVVSVLMQKGEPMEWIVEAESLSDFVDHGRYTIASKPLIRCRDCKYYRHNKIGEAYCANSIGIVGYVYPEDFCSRAKRRINEPDRQRSINSRV